MKNEKYQEGEIFALSLNAEETEAKQFKPPYAFGRLIAINPSKDTIVEIFKYHGEMTNNIKKIMSSGRLFDPVSVIDYARKKRWRRIYFDSDYTYEKGRFSEVKLSLGKLVWEGGNTRLMRADEIGKYEEYILYAPIQLEERIRKALGMNEPKPLSNPASPMLQEKEAIHDLNKIIEPFFYSENEGNILSLDCDGVYKHELFELRSHEGFCGNGYDWTSLAMTYIDLIKPDLKEWIKFEPEAGMFCVYSDNKELMKEFIIGFKDTCEDENLVRNLFFQTKLY